MISVVIPAYNREFELQRAVDSVLGQTFKNFELIVVDDGSTQSLAALSRFVKSCGHKFISIPQSGVAAARNRGAAEASHDWLAFLDSDDYWQPEKLECQLNYHCSNPEFKISQCEEIWIRNGRRVNPKKRHEMLEGEAFERSLELCCISPSSVMLRRDLFQDIGGFDERLLVCEDYDLWLRITSKEKVGLVKQGLVTKTGGHADQLSRSEQAMDRFRVYALVKLLAENDLNSHQSGAVLAQLAKKSQVLSRGASNRQVNWGPLFDNIHSWASSKPSLTRLNEQSVLRSLLCKLEAVIQSKPRTEIDFSDSSRQNLAVQGS